MKLSICITVYNQIQTLKERIDALISCPYPNIEFVISDDCSSEDIRGLVESYSDSRLRYVRTPHNLGHDLNILYGMRQCIGEYIFLFRTKDSVIIDSIPALMAYLEDNPNVGFLLSSAMNNGGSFRLKYPNKVFGKGEQALRASFRMLTHPSGGIYRASCLRFDLYEQYIKSFHDDIYAFDVHTMMRLDISQKADIAICAIPGWIYSFSYDEQNAAVNSTKDGINVYAPAYQYPRYICLFSFVKNEFSEQMRQIALPLIVRDFYRSICGLFLSLNHNPDNNSHYNSEPIDYSASKERKKFKTVTYGLEQGCSMECQRRISRILVSQNVLSYTYYPIRNAMNLLAYHNKALLQVWRRIRHVK